MSERQGTYSLVLRCHKCKTLFHISGLPIERIALIPQVTPCPHCSAYSVTDPAKIFSSRDTLHQIVDLKKEQD
jgi:hypothetical protein